MVVIIIFKIGEFSELTQVSIRMLRYYDETGLLKPDLVDKCNGYRLYSPQQIQSLNRIIFLRNSGFNVLEMLPILDKWDDNYVSTQLREKLKTVENTIKSEQKRFTAILHAIDDIKIKKLSVNYNVLIKSIPAYTVVSLRKTVSDYFAEGELWKELAFFIREKQLKIPRNEINFALYHGKEYKESDIDIEVCIGIDKAEKNL